MTQLPVPSDSDSHTLAEWLEASLLVEGFERFTQSAILQRFALGQRPSVAEVEFAAALVSLRATTLGPAYPYGLDEDGNVLRRPEGSNLYDFLLLMSLDQTPLRQNREYHRSDPLFDEVSAAAFRACLPTGARSIVFGWPPRDGRPTDFNEAITWVSEKLGVPEHDGNRPSHYKDAGVDVIAWTPFSDGLPGFGAYFVQNTVRMEFASKAKDVNARQWAKWIEVGPNPQVGFAIPFSVPPDDERWIEMNDSADVPLDRSRLVERIGSVEPALDAQLGEFNKMQVESIRRQLDTPAAQGTRVRKPRKTRRSKR